MTEKRAPTADQIRIGIDHGARHGKAPALDPAAAPLGTDEEAGGTPPSAEERRAAYEAEAAAGGKPYVRNSATPLTPTRSRWFLLLGFVLLAIAIGIAALVMRAG